MYLSVYIQAQEEEGPARDVRDMLWGHCRGVLESRPSSLPALCAVAYLTLVDIIRGTSALNFVR